MPFLETSPGVEIYYQIMGNQSAEHTILFIGGWTSDHTFWYPYLPHFHNSRCIIFDNRGAGRTRYDPRQGISIEDFMKDLLAILSQLAPDQKTFIFGISMGGMQAQYLALQAPDLCEKIVLLSSTGYIPPSAQFLIRTLVHAKNRGPEDLFVDLLIGRVFPPKIWETPRLQAYLKKTREYMLTRPQTALGCEQQAEAISNYDLRAWLGTISIPVMVIVGEKDILIPLEMSQELHNLIPKSNFLILPSEGHCPVEFEWLNRVREFFGLP